MSNDPERSQITIGLKGKIWVPIYMAPRRANLTGVVGDSIETVVSLRAEKKDPLKIGVISVSVPEKIAVELVEVEKHRSYQVKIKNKIDEQTAYNGQIKLSTNYPEKSEISIRVVANIRPLLEVRPNVMNLGRMSQERILQFDKNAQPFRRLASVILNKGDNLHIEKLELKKSLFTVTSKDLQVGRLVQIIIEPKFGNLKKGKNEDILRVHTNQKGHEILEIPLTIEIL